MGTVVLDMSLSVARSVRVADPTPDEPLGAGEACQQGWTAERDEAAPC
jgi:hypothetical protein